MDINHVSVNSLYRSLRPNILEVLFRILFCSVLTSRRDSSNLDFYHCCRLLIIISSQSHRRRKHKLQKVQTEFNVFFNTSQSNTRQDYAKANVVNALVFLSIEMQPAFRPLSAHQESRIDKKIQINKILQNRRYSFSSKLDFDIFH